MESDLATVRSLSPPVRAPGQPGLVILYGLPGSGKTHLGRLIAERCDAVALNTDVHRRAIVTGAPRYDGTENRRLFGVLNRRTAELLEQGQVVVFDSTALRDWIRRPLERIADEHRIEPIRVHLDPPEDVIFARLATRAPAPDPVDDVKTWRDVYEWMKPGWQPIVEPHLHLTDPDSIPVAIETIARMLGCADTAPA